MNAGRSVCPAFEQGARVERPEVGDTDGRTHMVLCISDTLSTWPSGYRVSDSVYK